MLPAIRCSQDNYSIPKLNLSREDIVQFKDELETFADQFRECFRRQEQRDSFLLYLTGLTSLLDRKSIEPIALAVENANVRVLQYFLSSSLWKDHKMLEIYRSMIKEDLGSIDAAIIFDESGFSKKGSHSAGVARQYCGTLGKVDSCQVGVYSTYTSSRGYAFLDKRLYLPEQWYSSEFAERVVKCGIPTTTSFQSKPQLAADMLQEIRKSDLPYRYILADHIYGGNPDFIAEIEKKPEDIYFVGIQSDTLCWLEKPLTRKKRYRYQGELREREVLEKTDHKPITIGTIAEQVKNYYWYQRIVSEGTKGPILYEFYRSRVTLAAKGMPTKTVWLIIRRTIASTPIYSFYLSNAPEDAPLSLFVWLSGLRWAIEQCFEEAKIEFGMDQYEVRKFLGWHHHMMATILIHFFLWHLKIRLGKKSTSYYHSSTESVDDSYYGDSEV